jgi:hypothetical protein
MARVGEVGNSFIRDVILYAQQMRKFDHTDWRVYFSWVFLMLGLFVSVSAFIGAGWLADAPFPAYVWNIPLGTIIFVGAISFDTIGHRTAYKEVLKKGEALVHHITIFAGITSCLLLCLAYEYRGFLYVPAMVMTILSIFYSVIDEALHWHRYMTLNSDRVEMWSHFFIFVGHLIMMVAWWKWFDEGYVGVAETLRYLAGS